MAQPPHDHPALSTRASPGHDLGADLLPLPAESPADYLARMKSLHARVGALVAAIEERRPALGPVPPGPGARRAPSDRRESAQGERRAHPERRLGLPDERAAPIDRRLGARERRRMRVDRREDAYARRREPGHVPWHGGFRLDGTAAMWAMQVLAWTAVVVVVLVWGLGD
jgi:hypothetical protein